jgi:hypothetical protein
MQRVDGLRAAAKKVVLPTEFKKRNSVGPPPDAPDGDGRPSNIRRRGRGD